MNPHLLNGDMILYRSIDPDQVTNGTVVVYMPTQTGIPALDYLVKPIVVHRVIGEIVQSDGVVYYRTKGDNNQFDDPGLVRSDHLLGTPVADLPLAGIFVLFIESPEGLVFAVAAVMFLYMAKYDRERQNEKSKKEFLAILARMSLNGELAKDQFEEFKMAIDYGEELPSQWLKNPVHASLADWIKHGGLTADWKEMPAKCPRCLQSATMIKGNENYLLICPRCSERGYTLSPGGSLTPEPLEPMVKSTMDQSSARGVMALALALGRLVRRKTGPSDEISA